MIPEQRLTQKDFDDVFKEVQAVVKDFDDQWTTQRMQLPRDSSNKFHADVKADSWMTMSIILKLLVHAFSATPAAGSPFAPLLQSRIIEDLEITCRRRFL
jgi:hypothetical protein